MPEKHINKICKNHGLTKFVLEGRGYYRCCKCRSQRVTERRKRIKLILVEMMGGKCSICGYNKCIAALDFHHESGIKEFGIASKGFIRSLDRCIKEAKKCILVCSNCHSEIHHNIRNSSPTLLH